MICEELTWEALLRGESLSFNSGSDNLKDFWLYKLLT
jgi:hypothetical protein